MKLNKFIRFFAPALLVITQSVIAASSSSIEFFVSNNTGTIDMPSAFQRLRGEEQHDLQNSIAAIMQKYHLQQGMMDDVLGTYQLTGANAVTADNTETFTSSPYEHMKSSEAFFLAQKLAAALKQESVAVFIPSDKAGSGDLQLQFTAPFLTISETMQAIQDKLPAQYSQAYSLHLLHAAGNYAEAHVASVEWLGSNTNANLVKNAFPDQSVQTRNGRAYLVYQNGKREQL